MLDETKLPSAEEMLEWIEAIVGQGIRRPGYPADTWTEGWITDKLRAAGVTDVRAEPVPLDSWWPRSATVQVQRTDSESPAVEFHGCALPYTAATAGLTAPLIRPGDPGSAGAIVVDELALQEIPQHLLRDAATGHYDPGGEFDTLTQIVPLGPLGPEVLEPALAAGAAGFIGALTGMPWETRDYYLPYDAVHRPLPALWLSPRDSASLLALMDSGPCTATIRVDAEIRPVTSANIVGRLSGASGHTVIVASHHDGPWASAVEDATGIAMVLAAATYFAALPIEQRPHDLVFLLTAGHMAGAAGTRAFIADHPAMLTDTVLQLHLEHAALRCEPVDGRLIPTGAPEVRWWFTTPAAELEKLVGTAISREGLHRSLILKPDTFTPMPPTDGAFFHPEGVPLVHFLSAPMYLFDSCDTLDKVDRGALVPLTRAAIRIIEGTRDRTPGSFRIDR